MFKVTLQNHAVPPLVLEHENIPLDEEMIKEIRRRWQSRQGGWKRGEPAITGQGVKVHVVGLDMQKLAIGDLIATSESRIAMVHGVPMILLGRSGTQSDPTRANYQEAKTHLWFDTVMPLLQSIAEQVTQSLLPEWPGGDELELGWDLSGVPVLIQERLDRLGKANEGWRTGLISRHAAQELAGVRRHGPDVFYRPTSVDSVIPADAEVEASEIAEV